MGIDIATTMLDESITLVELKGDAGLESSLKIKEILGDLLERGCSHLVVNLDALSMIDSSGLGALIEILKKTREKHGDMNLVCRNPYLKSIFIVTGLMKLFKVFSEKEKALYSLSNPTSECLECALFCGLPNCPVIKSLAYPAKPCHPRNRQSWSSCSFKAQTGEVAKKRRKQLHEWKVQNVRQMKWQ